MNTDIGNNCVDDLDPSKKTWQTIVQENIAPHERKIVEVLNEALELNFPSYECVIAEPGRYTVASDSTFVVNIIGKRVIASDQNGEKSAPVSTSQHPFEHQQLESQAHPFGCYLTELVIVHPAGFSSDPTHQNLSPGGRGEVNIRCQHNKKYAPMLELEMQTKIAEAGFVISDNKLIFSCQYCESDLTFDNVIAGCDFWKMHHNECMYLEVQKRRKQRQIVEALNKALELNFPSHEGVKIIAEPGRYMVASVFTLGVNIIDKHVIASDQNGEKSETVCQAGISSGSTPQSLVPGGLGELKLRFQHNEKCVPLLELEMQKIIAEAGFVISANEHILKCEYCEFDLTFDNVIAGCDLWTMHHKDCDYLKVHELDEQRQHRDDDIQDDPTRMLM